MDESTKWLLERTSPSKLGTVQEPAGVVRQGTSPKQRKGAIDTSDSAALIRDLVSRNRVDGIRYRLLARYYSQEAEWYGLLRQKYERASKRPWEILNPDPLPIAPKSRGNYLASRGEYAKATVEYAEALRLNPDDAETHNEWAWLLATCPDSKVRDGSRAVTLATRACELEDWKNAGYLDTLAAAYAEAKHFASAVQRQEEAIAKLGLGDERLAEFASRLGMYRSSQPYRRPPSR